MPLPPLKVRLYKALKKPLLPYRDTVKACLNHGKMTLARAMRWLKRQDAKFPAPAGIYTKQWHQSARAHSSGDEYVDVDDSQEVRYQLPKGAEPKLHWRFSHDVAHPTHPTFCASIPRGRVWGVGAAVIAPDNGLLTDLSRGFGLVPDNPQNHSIFGQWELPKPTFVEGCAAVLAAPRANNYFHWMFDVLPRFGLIKNAFPNKMIGHYLVNPLQLPFQSEMLGALGIPLSNVIQCNDSTYFEASELLAPSLPGYRGYVTSRSCNFLREHFGAAKGHSGSRRRIYVGRQNSSLRRVIDEEKLIATLEKFGFEAIAAERMTVAQQAEIFASAEAVIGPHGAGLSNLVFCQPGTKVVEIFSPLYVNPCIWTMASHVGLSYFYLLGAGRRPPENVNPELGEADISIDYPALYRTLELAGI